VAGLVAGQEEGVVMVRGFAGSHGLAVRRIALLSVLVLGLLVAPSAADATISSVFGTVTCAVQGPGATEGQRWCGSTSGTTVPSWDGAPIDVTASFPPAAGPDNNYPVVGIYHGWGGTKILPSNSATQRWLKLGYAVFSISDRGWGGSCGGPSKPANTFKAPPCERGYIHLMARAYEVRDVQYLLGLLADEGVINPQQIASTGGSYGGGMSLQLGSLKDRVQLPSGELIPWVSPKGTPLKIAATAPEFPWTDLAQSLQPNGSNLDYVANAPYSGMLGNHEFGIQKRNWNESLFNAGAFLGYYAPTSAADPEANLVEWNTFNSTGGPYNGKALAIQQEQQLPNHSPYYTDLSEPPAPSIMENGWNDDLFPVDQTVDYYNKVRAAYPSEPVQLFDLDLGHNPRSSNTPSTTDVGKLIAAQNAWFEYYVKGQGSEPAKAQGGVTAITSVCPATSGSSGTEYKASNWASLAPGEIRLEGAAEQTIQAPGTAPALAFTAGKTDVCTTQAAGNNASAATYKLAPAPAEGFTIAGASTVVGEFSTPAENDQIIARLYDVNEGAGGTQQLIGRAIYRPISPGGGFVRQVFQLHPQAWKIAGGHVLKLELLVQDSTYVRSSSSPASIQVKNLELRVPTIEPPGSDGGLVQAPQVKYLPPGYTFARDVQTTAPGVPFLSSGTNPNSGVFTLSWSPSAPAAGLTYNLQHKNGVGGWSTVATGLTSPEYAFTSGSREEEGTLTYRVSASNEGAESEFSGASAEIVVERKPKSVTEAASSITQTSAILNGSDTPNGETVSDCHFEYGTTMSYGISVPCSSPPGSGESPVAVSASLSTGSLSEDTTYHYRLVSTNANGTSFGSDETFTTLPNAPAVVTGSASSVTQTSATLNATVNPEGGAVSDCHFDYGTSEAYGSSAPCTSLPGSGESPVAVSAPIGSLTANTAYHFRIVATNPGGTSYGTDQTFTTLANPNPAFWYKNGTKVKQGVKVPTFSWGTLTLHTPEGPVTCHTVSGGFIENPVGGGAGVSSTEVLAGLSCVAPGCPVRAEVRAENLPWSSTLSETGGVVRAKSTGVGVRVKCYTGTESEEVLSNVVYSGEWSPSVISGPTAAKPSFDEFDAASGELLGGAGSAKPSGKVKVMGYEQEEVITAK
jgi:acetyl esterase/lipase